MDNKEIRNLSMKDLIDKIKDEKKDYYRIKMNHSVTALENPMLINKKRKFIARLHTQLSVLKKGDLK